MRMIRNILLLTIVIAALTVMYTGLAFAGEDADGASTRRAMGDPIELSLDGKEVTSDFSAELGDYQDYRIRPDDSSLYTFFIDPGILRYGDDSAPAPLEVTMLDENGNPVEAVLTTDRNINYTSGIVFYLEKDSPYTLRIANPEQISENVMYSSMWVTAQAPEEFNDEEGSPMWLGTDVPILIYKCMNGEKEHVIRGIVKGNTEGTSRPEFCLIGVDPQGKISRQELDTEFSVVQMTKGCRYWVAVAETNLTEETSCKVTYKIRSLYPGLDPWVNSIKAGKKSFKVEVGFAQEPYQYEFCYSPDKKFRKDVTFVPLGSKYGYFTTKVKNLKAKKKYYVKTRAYMEVKGVKYPSKWSKKAVVKTK